MRTKLLVAATATYVLLTASAQAECFGKGSYRVCSESYQNANGDFHVRSSDTEGNSYSVKSWSDFTGVHSVDSEGNECTITNSGVVIGCGE